MQVDQGGVSLWYATDDALAPSGRVANGDGLVVTIGLRPPDARANVTVLYRVNHGPPQTAQAQPCQPPKQGARGKQYFRAKLKPFRGGDHVEYVAIYRSGGRQVPSKEEAERAVVTFTVAAPGGTQTAPRSGTTNSNPGQSASAGSDAGAPGGAGRLPSRPASAAAPNSRSSPAATRSGALRKSQLLTLARLADSKVAEIQHADAALGKFLVDKIAAERKTAVLSGLKGSSATLIAAVQKVDFSPASPTGATIREAIDAGLAAQRAGLAVLREAAQKLDKLERSRRLADMADPATPIAQHPLFAPELKEAALYLLTDSVKLADSKAARLVDLAGSAALVDDDMLASLVADKTLTAAEAASLGLLLSLCLLAGGNAALAVEIKPKVAALPDIAKVSAEEWWEAITRAKARSPEGLDDAGYAAALRRAATNLYPTEALHVLTIPADTRALEQALAAVAPLAAKNPEIFGRDFDELDATALGAEQRQAASSAHRQLQALVNQHPGLQLADILNGHNAPAKKIATVLARLGLLTKLRALNPDREFMGLDYTEGSADREALKSDGLSPADLHLAVADLKAAQRLHALTRDVDHTSAIMAAGYASASAVAIDDPNDFERKSGLSHGLARHYHEKATSTLSKASHAVISALDAFDGPFQHTRAGNARPGIKDHLKAIPGFTDLFGSQDYCNCTECQSIIGAAAYFVDLMTFVEENLTGRVFRGAKTHDPLNLKVRRPDLWTLPLTCDNTNDMVSYLDIINPTLEDYIAGRGLGHPAAHHDEHRAGDHREHHEDHHGEHGEDHRGKDHAAAHADRRAGRKAPSRSGARSKKVGSTERPAAATLVYQNTLAKSQASFQQPFVLPLEKIDIYLEHFVIPRVQIARALGAEPAVIVKAALKISDRVFRQLTDANPDQAFLRRVYGIPFVFAGAAAHVAALDVQDMMRATAFSRPDFEAAATTRFVTKNGTYPIHIRSEKKNADSVQNDVEYVHGLNADALDRLYRFTRLLRATPWSVLELDMILAQLAAAGSTSGLEEPTLYRLTQLLQLRTRWPLPVDQSCALWSPIPTEPAQGNLFDRLFNFPPLLVSDSALPVSNVRFVHAAFSPTGTAQIIPISASQAAASPAASDLHKTTQRILAGLQVSDSDLVLLISAPAAALAVGPGQTQIGFIPSLNNLTLLYRHASLARLLNLRVPQLFQLIELAGLTAGYVATLNDLMGLLQFYDWYQASGYQLDDLGTITQEPVLNPAAYPAPATLATQLVEAVATDHLLEFADKVFVSLLGVTEAESQQMIAGNPALFAAVPGAATPTFQLTPQLGPGTALQFADTVLAFQPGVSEQQSQQIVAANPALFRPVANATPAAWQLSTTFGPGTTTTIPDGIPVSPADANAALVRYSGGAGGAAAVGSGLLNYHPSMVIPTALSGLLGIDAQTLTALLAMTGADLSSAEIFQALQAGADPPPAALVSLIGQIVPLQVMFTAAGYSYTVDDLNYIQQNSQLFAIANFNALTVANVEKLSVYARFAANLGNSSTGATPLRDVLASFSTAAHFGQANQAELAAILGIDQKQLPALLPNLMLPPTVPEALTSLSSIAALTISLGIGGDALKLLISDDYTDQSLASDAVLGAFRAQYHDEQDFLDRAKPFDDRVRQRKRDGLTDYLLTWTGYRFATLDDLYNYFLLDVQLEGCMKTSWVVAAISSVQLYVYRCLLNLEQDQRDPDDPDNIHVIVPASAAEQWEWRKNYRVWQANREVFLYPESYILPELRDDKTPLFEDLESTLLQQPINEQNVLDAYSTYMTGFDQLSKLKIAGSYHEIDTDTTTDVLHLFGVTPQDPPTFFYRTIENASHGETETDRAVTYTPWVPVNLQIHCREISPIVYLGRLFVFWTQITTQPQNPVVSANSIFDGYKHSWRVKYSSLRLDQTWTPPQQLALTDPLVFAMGDGVVSDPLLDSVDKDQYGSDGHTTTVLTALAISNPDQDQKNWISHWASNLSLTSYENELIPLYGNDVQTASVDGYTLLGYQWDRVYPTLSHDSQEMLLTGRNFCMRAEKVDFYEQVVDPTVRPGHGGAAQTVLCSRPDARKGNRSLYSGVQDAFPKLERYPWCSIVAKEEYIQKLAETAESADLYLADMETFDKLGAQHLAAEAATSRRASR
jgi:hypothetical protein